MVAWQDQIYEKGFRYNLKGGPMSEAWKDKLPAHTVEAIESFRRRKGKEPLSVIVMTAKDDSLHIPVPREAHFKKIKITISLAEDFE